MSNPKTEYFSVALQPYEDESISHYLGRWKRQEVVSLSSIGSLSRPTAACEKHQLRLLYKCPNCEVHFPIPAEWESGRCRKCQMLFRSMIKHQKPARTYDLMDTSVST